MEIQIGTATNVVNWQPSFGTLHVRRPLHLKGCAFPMPQKRERLQRVRRRAGLTQEQLAYRLDVDRSTVGRWEAGQTTPHPWQQPRLAKLLGITRVELDSLFTEGQPAPATVPGTAVSPLGLDEEACTDDEVNRRNLLKALGIGAASVSSLGGTRALVLDAAHTSALLRASMETHGVSYRALTYAREQLAKLATAYVLTSDLDPILRELVVLRSHLAAIATTRHHPSDGRDLYQLLGAACALLASISHDLSEPRAGMTQADAAATFAELSGHGALTTWVSCTKAMIASWWETPHAVLDHAAKARAANPCGIAAIRLAGLEARALAELGRAREAITVVCAAEEQRGRVGEYDDLRELGDVFAFPTARQHYYSATTYRHLGQWEDVERETSRVIGLYGASASANTWPVTLTLSQIYQAQARLHLDGPDGAREALRPVFSIPPGLRLPQTTQALSGLRGALQAKRFAALPAATDLREEIVSFQPPAANTDA